MQPDDSLKPTADRRLARVLRIVALTLAIALGFAPGVAAQHLRPVAATSFLRPVPAEAPSSPPAQQLSASRHFWTGAAVGVGVLGVASLFAFSDCLGCSPLIIAPVVIGGGTLVGGSVGLLVYWARRR